MTSLALAHSHSGAPFNADFYVAAATVIPVLWLALAVQDGSCQDLLRTALMMARAFEAGQSPFKPTTPRAGRVAAALPLQRAARLMLITAWILAAAGFVGEAEAISALYTRSAAHFARPTVIACAIVLLFAVVTAPLQLYIRTSLSMPAPVCALAG